MSPLAVLIISFLALLIGFLVGYVSGRAEDRDPRRGHPYDYHHDQD